MTLSAAATIASPAGRLLSTAISDVPRRLQRWYLRRRDLREARAAFMHVVRLEERVLDDMGVTREEVHWAASLPIEVNAARALQTRAQDRRARVSPSARSDRMSRARTKLTVR